MGYVHSLMATGLEGGGPVAPWGSGLGWGRRGGTHTTLCLRPQLSQLFEKNRGQNQEKHEVTRGDLCTFP